MSRPFRCPACGGGEAERLFVARERLHGLPGEFWIVRCRGCGLKATHPAPEDLARYYPSGYGPHVEARVGGFRSLAVIVPPLPPRARCVEIGSGAGAFVRHLRSLGHEAIGVDPAGGDVPGELADARLASGSVDAVFAWQALEHVPDLRATVDEVARVLKPGGWFAFAVPNAGSWEASWFRGDWYALEAPRHLWHLRPRDVARVLGGAFRLVRLAGQRNLSNVVGSLGLALGVRAWVEYPQRPSRVVQGALYPLAALVASLGQAGRMTGVARRI